MSALDVVLTGAAGAGGVLAPVALVLRGLLRRRTQALEDATRYAARIEQNPDNIESIKAQERAITEANGTRTLIKTAIKRVKGPPNA